LTSNPHERRQNLLNRLKAGAFLDLCEIVRDLTAQSWRKALGEADKLSLRKARDGLCHEWALVDGVPLVQAMEEIDALLRETRQVSAVSGG
jgi:RNA polymerase-interacting CarD/CdnL/TRCF family regulator